MYQNSFRAHIGCVCESTKLRAQLFKRSRAYTLFSEKLSYTYCNTIQVVVALMQELVESGEDDTVTTDHTRYCNNMHMGISFLHHIFKLHMHRFILHGSHLHHFVIITVVALLFIFAAFQTSFILHTFVLYHFINCWDSVDSTERFLTVHMKWNTLNLDLHSSPLFSAGVQVNSPISPESVHLARNDISTVREALTAPSVAPFRLPWQSAKNGLF